MSKRRIILLGIVIVLALIGFAGWRFLVFPVTHPASVSSMRFQQGEEITPLDTPTNMPPTPTETLLPTQELPTPESTSPVFEFWIDLPTYMAESQPGFAFRVEFDASLWALTQDETGQPALLHREIPYCKITSVTGRGTSRDMLVESKFADIGPYRFEVVTVSRSGVVQFVNYFGGDGVVFTGFQVSFQEQSQACIQAAENIFVTLSSVMAPTPTLTPTETPTETPIGTSTETFTPIP